MKPKRARYDAVVFALVNGIRMYYELYGEPVGTPLLFIHGFPLSGEMWRDAISAFSNQYKVIVPDLRGFGRTEVAAQVQRGVAPAISIAQYADDLASLMEELGEQRPAVIIGHSMGGYIAFELFRRNADHVFALALVNTRAAADSPEAATGREQTADKVLAEGTEVIANGMVEKLFAPASSHEMRERWRKLISATPREGAAAALLAMAKRADSSELLATIHCPTLVIAGEKDVIIPATESRQMQQAIPAAALTVIAGAGHMTPVEQPQAFGEALMQFLHQHVPPGQWRVPSHD